MTDNKLAFAEEGLELSFGYDIDAIWYNNESMCPEFGYFEKIDAFCYVLKVAMEKGILKIASEGSFLEGTPQEISDRFKSSFPISEERKNE